MEKIRMINRGSFTVVPKKAYWDWNNRVNPEMQSTGEGLDEYSTYLISNDWMSAEEAREQYWQQVFEEELDMVTPEKDDWPQNRSQEMFEEWFDSYLSADVTDLEEGPVEKD